jgi:hypothetical protein
MELLVVLVLLVLLDVAAMRWGYDSRDAAHPGAPYPRHAGLLAPPEPPEPRAPRRVRSASTPRLAFTRPTPLLGHPLRPTQPAPLVPISASRSRSHRAAS